MKTLIIYLLFVFVFNVSSVYSQNTVGTSKVFYSGETLVYKVKWTFIRIGTITIKTNLNEDNPDYIKVSMLVESNPSIPFLNIKEYNETVIDRQTFMSNSYYGYYENGGDGTKYYTKYNEDSKSAIWKVYDVTNHRLTDSTTIYNCVRYVDGPSLFFFTRVNSHQGKTIKVPTIIDGKIESTKLVFTGTKEEIEIDALDYPIITRQYFGFADWEGGSSQSLSGDFMGWISDDDAAIPVYAEVKVLLGKLKIELESWERGNWNKLLDTAGAR
ncbi:MAG TPA: hypothetical protein DHV28_12410 [Ignavibacteriales bacterium]|nr:hypothetical protein [Ignavibacteriales bacterium]